MDKKVNINRSIKFTDISPNYCLACGKEKIYVWNTVRFGEKVIREFQSRECYTKKCPNASMERKPNGKIGRIKK